MEEKIKVVGEPELYDIIGNRLHLNDKVAIPINTLTISTGIIVSLGKVKIKVKYKWTGGRLKEKLINANQCIKYE